MSNFLDNFAGASGSISTHTSDSGQGVVAGYLADPDIDGTGGLYVPGPAAQNGFIVSGYTPAGADQVVEFAFTDLSTVSGEDIGVLLRCGISPNPTGYFFEYFEGHGYYIEKIVNGGYTTWGPFAGPGRPTTGQRFRARASGSSTTTLTFDYWDGSAWQTINARADSSSPITDAGSIGFGGNAPQTASTGLHLDYAAMAPLGSALRYTLSGPTTGSVGTPLAFTVTPTDGTVSGTITLTPSGCGLSTPTTLTFAGTSAPQVASFTPAASGTLAVTPSNNQSLIDPPAASAAVASSSASSYTATLGASSGYIHEPVTITYQANGSPSPGLVVTPSVSGISGAFSPTTLTIADASAHSVAFTPATAGTATLGQAHAGGGFSGDPASHSYIVSPATLSLAPASVATNATTTITGTGQGTTWSTTAPSLSASGVAGCTLGTPTVASDTSFTVAVTTGGNIGTLAIADATSGASANLAVAAVASKLFVAAFGASGLPVGYTLYNPDGTTFQARTTSGVHGVGAAGYGFLATIPSGSRMAVVADDGAGSYQYDAFDASGVVAVVSDKTGFKLAQDGLDAISTAAPAGVASTFPQMVVQTWRRFFKKATRTTTQLKTFADDGTTPLTTQAISDDGASNETQGAAQ